MSRFSPEQRKHIQNQLLNVGHILFAKHGLKKTSFDELTTEVGIAKSSFYAFYNSKEHLYLELLEIEAEGMEKRVWRKVHQAENTKDALAVYMTQMVEEMGRNPLTKRLITNQAEIILLEQRVTPDMIARKTRRNIEPLIAFIQQEQQAGRIVHMDAMKIVAAMRLAMGGALYTMERLSAPMTEARQIVFESLAEKLTNNRGW